MSVINSFFVSGNVTRDAAESFTPGGLHMVRFSIAQNSYRKNETGEGYTESVQYLDLSAIGKTADYLAKLGIQKGDHIVARGNIKAKQTQGPDGKTTTALYLNVEEVDRSQKRAATQERQPTEQAESRYDEAEETEDAPF